MAIFLHCRQVSYNLANGLNLFKNADFSLIAGTKYGLIGKNGIGKSTLLHILRGELIPQSGQVTCHWTIEYVPQNLDKTYTNVIEATGKALEYKALTRIEAGQGTMADFELLENQWDFLSRIEEELKTFALDYLDLTRDYNSLSGGEKNRLALVGAFASHKEILIFDEPTNNLDTWSKELFIKRLEQSRKLILIVSHDRNVLEKLDCILELKADKVELYGGNFSLYQESKAQAAALLEKEATEVKKEIGKLNESLQVIQTQQATRAKTGKTHKDNKKWLPGLVGTKKNIASATEGKNNLKLEKKKEEINQRKNELAQKQEKETFINFPSFEKKINTSQRVLEAENLCFAYPDSETLICNNVNLTVFAGQRVAIEGRSGAGKSTLLKLLAGKLKPSSGKALCHYPLVYMDQNLSFLDNNLTALENCWEHNPKATIQEIRYALGRFRFRHDTVEKNVGILSGGERVKLALACIMGIKMPDILFLDEPTNNLDLESIEIMESAFKSYNGTCLLVSHDTAFKNTLNLSCVYTFYGGVLSLNL